MNHQGLIYALCALACWGFAPLFAKMGLGKLEPLTALFFRNTFAGIAFIAAFLLSGQAKYIVKSDFKSVSIILVEALLAGIIGQYFYYKAVKTWEVSRVVPIVGSYPLISFVIAVILLSEKLTLLKFAGAVLIVTGIALLGI